MTSHELSSHPATVPARRARHLRQRVSRPILAARGTLGRHLSVRWKLTLWYALVYLLTLIIIGFSFPTILDIQTRASVDSSLTQSADQLAIQLHQPLRQDNPQANCGPGGTLAYEICLYRIQVHTALVSEATRVSAPGQFAQVQIFPPGFTGAQVSNSPDAPLGINVPAAVNYIYYALAGKPQFADAKTPSGEALRVYARRFTLPPILAANHVYGVLLVAQTQHTYIEIQRAIALIVLVGAPVGLLLAIVVGWVIARMALRPIGRISRTVQTIGESQDLTRRLDYIGPTDEVSRLAETFDGMMDRLEKVFVTQRRFIGDASHELRTPLTAIRGNADLLLIAPPAERDLCIRTIQREADRMSRLIGDLLLLAEADVAERVVHLQPTALDDILEDVYRATSLLAGDKLTVRLAPFEPVWVMGDPDRLKQLFLNLADNAVKFTPPGGRVSLSLRTQDDQAVVKVSDTGVGIPQEEQDSIFQRFYRVEASRSTRGSGLGLAICASIVKAHGGTIEVRGKPGQGSTFTVRLPALIEDDAEESLVVDATPQS